MQRQIWLCGVVNDGANDCDNNYNNNINDNINNNGHYVIDNPSNADD